MIDRHVGNLLHPTTSTRAWSRRCASGIPSRVSSLNMCGVPFGLPARWR
jgi:hypothetical protein